MRLSALVLVFTLIAGASPAVAQGPLPPTSSCGPFDVSVLGPPDPIEPGASATLTVTVENLNRATTAHVVLSAITPSEGWTIVSEAEQDNDVQATDSGAFQVLVRPDEGAVAEATVSFNILAECALGPLPCPDGQTACRSTMTETATLRLAEPEGLDFPILGDLDITPELLVAGLLLLAVVIAVPLLTRRRQGGVTATCPEPLKLLRPGTGVSFPIEVRNRTKGAVTATFEVGAVPEGWNAFMAMPDLQLAPGESRSLWLMVRSPLVASAGDKTDVPIRVRPSTGEVTLLRVRAEIDLNVSDARPSGSGSPSP